MSHQFITSIKLSPTHSSILPTLFLTCPSNFIYPFLQLHLTPSSLQSHLPIVNQPIMRLRFTLFCTKTETSNDDVSSCCCGICLFVWVFVFFLVCVCFCIFSCVCMFLRVYSCLFVFLHVQLYGCFFFMFFFVCFFHVCLIMRNYICIYACFDQIIFFLHFTKQCIRLLLSKKKIFFKSFFFLFLSFLPQAFSSR